MAQVNKVELAATIVSLHGSEYAALATDHSMNVQNWIEEQDVETEPGSRLCDYVEAQLDKWVEANPS